MKSERWRRLDALVAAALERPAGERGRFLERECAGDQSLRLEAESLLAVDEEAEGFLEDAGAVGGVLGAAAVGELLGPYRVEREIGSGGMGVVYLASRADDVYRGQVAIKLLRAGVHSAALIRRFHGERQILASLDHPSIARLLDGGATADGRPYLVMEYIDGSPIDVYCDARRLSVRRRLELFRKVCAAVHYAHQNLVVHRDLKPSNILIAAGGTPRLLDFGIAKLLDPERFALTVEATTAGLRPMTPRYASPEQVRGAPITTSDVYSLGVLLFELLTGRLPHRVEGLRPQQLERLLAGIEPPRPSSAVLGDPGAAHGAGGEAATAEELSHRRDTRPAQLRRRLAGDLDHIVTKALRGEPAARYGSVEQLSEDLRRHLEGLPVLARQDAFGYQVRTFLRRYRWPVAAAGVILALVVSFAAAMASQAAKTARQRDLAERERDRARQQRQRAQQVSEFMVDLFRGVDPWIARGDQVTARQVLERGAEKIERELRDQPEVRASLQAAIGTTYLHLALYDQSARLLESALATREATLGADHPDVADSLNHLASVYRRQGRYDEVESLYRRSLEIRERALGGDDPGVAESLRYLSNLYRDQGRFSEAVEAGGRALEIYRRALGPGHEEVGATLASLAGAALLQGRPEEGQRLLEEALEILEKAHGEVHVATAGGYYNLGNLRLQLGAPADAERHFRRALASFSRLFDGPHPHLAAVHLGLASVAKASGRLDAERDRLQQALAIYESTVGEEHDLAAMCRFRLGSLELRQDRLAAAAPLLEGALALRERSLGPDHPLTAESLLSVAELRRRQGRPSESVAICRRARPIWERHSKHPGLAAISEVCPAEMTEQPTPAPG